MANTIITRTKDGTLIHFECHDSVESTAALARKYAECGYSDRYIVFSENQTKLSAVGKPLGAGEVEHGIFISCILRPSIFPSQAGFLGIMSAVSLIKALEEHTTKRLGLGWISDIYCEGKKIGCVTTEGKLDNFSSYEYIIITFSVRLSNDTFPPRLADLVKKVFESENTSINMIIAKNILNKFFDLYPRCIKSPDKFIDHYKQKFLLRGRKTKFFHGGKRRTCKILGVDITDGTLIVEYKSKLIKISAQRNIVMPNKIKLKNP